MTHELPQTGTAFKSHVMQDQLERTDWIDRFHERAAIKQYEAGMTKEQAEHMARNEIQQEYAKIYGVPQARAFAIGIWKECCNAS